MNSVMGCLADCAELLPNDSYYSEYCGGPLGGQGEATEAASDTTGLSNHQRRRSDDAPGIWSEELAAPTGQRGRSGSETGQGTDERFDVDVSRSPSQQSPTVREAAWNAGKQQATRPRLPPKDLPAAAKRAADAAKRAAKAFALAEEAARAAKAAEETADRAVRAAESAANKKMRARDINHRPDGRRIPRDEAQGVDSDGSRVMARLPYSSDPSGMIIRPVIQHSPPTTIEEVDEDDGSDGLDVLGRMDSAAESDGGRELHTMSGDGNVRPCHKHFVSSKPGRGSRMSMSSVKSIASSSPIFDVSSDRQRAMSSSASLGTERREKRAVSVELSEVSDSDVSGVMVGSLAATPSLAEDPTAAEAEASGHGDGDGGRNRAAPAEPRRDWDGQGGSAADGVRQAKPQEEVGWHGRMHERAASMGEQWRQLAQANIGLESKLSSLSTDSSGTESAIDPDSLTAGTPTGITTEEVAGRPGRIWPVSPEGREEPRAGPAVECVHVTTHLRNIELSQDGTVLIIRPDDGGAQMNFTLDDLLEVKENLSEETVTLVSRHLKISIAFEGQAMALQQFSATLMKAFTESAKGKEKHSAELPRDVVGDHEAEKLVLHEGEDIDHQDSDEEDLPISHPERLTPSSSITAVSTHTNRTRASTGSRCMWHGDNVDKAPEPEPAPETSAVPVPWDTLTASPVVSISSTTSSNTWGRSGASRATATSRQREAFQALPKAEHEWEVEFGGDKFESLREMPTRSPRSLLSSAQSHAEREERTIKARSLRLERRQQQQQRKARKAGSAPIERLSVVAASLSKRNPTNEREEVDEAETLLREARKARTQARVRSQEEGVYSRLNSSTGPASESNHSDVPASSAPASAPASEVDEREDSLVIEEKPSLSDAGEEAADSAVDDNRHGTGVGVMLADKKA